VEIWLWKFHSWVALKEREGEAELETEIEDNFKWMNRLKLFGYVQVIEQYRLTKWWEIWEKLWRWRKHLTDQVTEMLWTESSGNVKKNGDAALDQIIKGNIKYGEIVQFYFAVVFRVGGGGGGGGGGRAGDPRR
jgi:hypothetical protein